MNNLRLLPPNYQSRIAGCTCLYPNLWWDLAWTPRGSMGVKRDRDLSGAGPWLESHWGWCLVGGAITILKNDGVRQWEGWHPIYEMENSKNLWNHQPANIHGLGSIINNAAVWLNSVSFFGGREGCTFVNIATNMRDMNQRQQKS